MVPTGGALFTTVSTLTVGEAVTLTQFGWTVYEAQAPLLYSFAAAVGTTLVQLTPWGASTSAQVYLPPGDLIVYGQVKDAFGITASCSGNLTVLSPETAEIATLAPALVDNAVSLTTNFSACSF